MLLPTKNKCDFYDDCGTWISDKGRSTKTMFIESNGTLRHTEKKADQYCYKIREKKVVKWVPFDPQPQESRIVTLCRYYARNKTSPDFQKRVSFFKRNTDVTLGNIALYEYCGSQLGKPVSHGNNKNPESQYVRTNPKTMDKIRDKVSTNLPREVFRELKKDDSMNCARDFEVIRNQKYLQKKKQEGKRPQQGSNVADELLEVIGMTDNHPFVQSIIHNKNKVPTIICYTDSQIKDLKSFLSTAKGQPLGIDRTFNLGCLYVTTIVYKNHKLVRKNSPTEEHPIFLGPVMLHKDATFKTYKTFLEHVKTELSHSVESLEIRLPENMEFGTDDERALTNAIEHVFPDSTRYLCTKHLKDNVKHYLQNKVGVERKQREEIMTSIFGDNGIVDANTTIDFETRSTEIANKFSEDLPTFTDYFNGRLKPKLYEHVFKPNRQNSTKELWTNNNAESINNIFKLSVDWKPKRAADLVEKIYDITELHFMDYRSAMHDSGNYRLTKPYQNYKVSDAVWRCKTEEEKRKLFEGLLTDRKKPVKSSQILSSDGKYSVTSKASGKAEKPQQRKRPRNERTRKR